VFPLYGQYRVEWKGNITRVAHGENLCGEIGLILRHCLGTALEGTKKKRREFSSQESSRSLRLCNIVGHGLSACGTCISSGTLVPLFIGMLH
jgi:hypothetical protein